MRRSNETELADSEDISEEDLARNYRELEKVQRWLGNTGQMLTRLRRARASTVGPMRVLDIGCGRGGLLKEIQSKLGMDVIGMELRPAPAGTTVPIMTGNAVSDPLPRADVAVCMMLAHHLSETELVQMIRNISQYCNRFILLDLVRHPVPLLLFRVFVAPLLFYVNAADGKTSIRRAYTVAEMRKIVENALGRSTRPVKRVRHSMSPFWTRQVVEIEWD